MIPIESILKACRFETSRSSGPGGQHVNKTESKVMVFFDISHALLDPEQQAMLHIKYPNRINQAGELYLQSSSSRSQIANKEATILKLRALIEAALIPRKKRFKTKKSKSSIEARLNNKKLLSKKKKGRGKSLDL